ncbi:hypothetical protein METBIDRAFT_10921 [Metschnikowia bicuspidata var. bicuspidata NRRL YB-4993]|uniref:Uncharacterized protein n=1 Tax=Metschnikowia bicuspidata var. bicuspidata NRRL YB-4993 TaxID=869754 RepID=A0A1A0HDG9_9ASCO|nr:hypothetical protein METBIDRAFT_10921 [Metschnikowia bicuspidata var. bicuspidata NRRL YB-4993]OBA22020.1 hypothetical protein METBIDRAFT_10921 [Metschnikowia bicuspidata var. bicuspidata NRRL YB-4993]
MRFSPTTQTPSTNSLSFQTHNTPHSPPVAAMDNRRVAKVYRDRSQRVRKLPPAAAGGIFSKVKRYLSTSGLPARIASLRTGANEAETPLKQQPGPLPPGTPAAAETSAFLPVSADRNRILLSFFQEKGSQPLSEVEYEGVMALLDRSKASVTLPLPELTPERKSGDPAAAKAATNANNTFAQYSQKVLRNTSGYDASNATSVSLAAADYKPAYHTFHDVSRGSISMKRVYPLSAVPSPYRTRIQVPNLAARKARRVASAAPLMALLESAADASMDSRSFKPKSNTANSLLLILDGASGAPHADASASAKNAGGKSLHNPYAKAKRFTPLQKEDIFAKAPSPTKADEISRTVAYNKAKDLAAKEDPEPGSSLFGTLSPGAPEKPASAATDAQSTKPQPAGKLDCSPLASGSSIDSRNPVESPNAAPVSLFGSKQSAALEGKPNDTIESPAKDLEAVSAEKPNTKPSPTTPAFSFGSKPLTSANTDVTSKTLPTSSSTAEVSAQKPTLSFGFGDVKPASSSGGVLFGAKSKAGESTVDPSSKTTKPLFGFGQEGGNNASMFTFGSKPNTDSTSSNQTQTGEPPKPAFHFGTKTADDKNTTIMDHSRIGQADANKSHADEGNNKSTKPNLFAFSSKPAEGISSFGANPAMSFNTKTTVSETSAPNTPAFNFGINSSHQTGTPAFSFGSKASEPVSKSQVPAFNLEAKTAIGESAKSAFDFGVKQSEDKFASPLSLSTEPDKSKSSGESASFNFRSKPISDDPVLALNFESKSPHNFPSSSLDSKSSSNMPTFKFGAEKLPHESASIKPAFTFGEFNSHKKLNLKDLASEKSDYGFGQVTPHIDPNSQSGAMIREEKLKEQRPEFGFGIQKTEKPTSTFSFSTKLAEKKSESTQPSFSFGANHTKYTPTFSFGANSASEKNVSDQSVAEPRTQVKVDIEASNDNPVGQNPALSGDTQVSKEKQHNGDSRPSFVSKATEGAFSLGNKNTNDMPVIDHSKQELAIGTKAQTTGTSFDTKPLELETNQDKKLSSLEANAFPTNPALKLDVDPSAKVTHMEPPSFSFGSKLTDVKSTFGFNPPTTCHAFGIFGNASSDAAKSKPAFAFGAKPGGNTNEIQSKDQSSKEEAQSLAFSSGSVVDNSDFEFACNPNPTINFGSKSSSTVSHNHPLVKDDNERTSETYEFGKVPTLVSLLNQEKVKEFEKLFPF